MDDVWQLISDWRFLVMAVAFLISLPLIFYISSFDKSPPKIIKIAMKKKKANKLAKTPKPTEDQAEEEQKIPPQQDKGLGKKNSNKRAEGLRLK